MNYYQEIAQQCRFLLQNCPEAEFCRDYLNSRISQEMQDLFSIGYFPDTNNINLLTSLVSSQAFISTEIINHKTQSNTAGLYVSTYNFFEHHPLIIPFKDLYGNIIALVGRSLLNDHERKALKVPKYKNTYFKKGEHLFGLHEAKQEILKKNLVYVVEGQFDVIKAFEKGLTNIVAVGNSNISSYQLSLICRYTKNVMILFDNDEAGDLGKDRALDKYSSYANLGIGYLPQGYTDIDQFLKENSIEDMSFVIKNLATY